MNGKYDEFTLKKVQQTEYEIMQDVFALCEKHAIDVFLVYGSAIGAVRHKGFIPWDDDVDLAMFRSDFERFAKFAVEELGDRYEILSPETNPNYGCTVTHFMKRGTSFISEDMKNAGVNVGLNVDIFIYDHLAPTRFQRDVQWAKSYVLGRLLFLSGQGTPYIPYQGKKKRVAEMICQVARGGMRLLGITPAKVFSWYKKNACRYNHIDTKYYCSFETRRPWINVMTLRDIYPLRPVPFEEGVAYIPNKTDKYLRHVFGDYMELPPVEERYNHRPYRIDFGQDN